MYTCAHVAIEVFSLENSAPSFPCMKINKYINERLLKK